MTQSDLARRVLGVALCVAVVNLTMAADAAEGDAGQSLPSLERVESTPDGGAGAVAEGRRIFHTHCAICHGAGAVGTPGAPDLTDDRWRNDGSTYGRVVSIIRDGVALTPMPAWKSRLTEGEIADVAAYVYQFRFSGRTHRTETDNAPGDGELIEPSTRLADLLEGKRTFMVHCSNCHGAQAWGGEGGPNLTDDKWRNDVRTFSDLLGVIANGVRRAGMPDWYRRISAERVFQTASFIWYLQSCPTEFWQSCLERQ